MRRLPLRSPPRMRGKVWLHQKPGRVPGITPAYAGKSQRTAFPVAGGQDHPRVCGEKCTRQISCSSNSGSPPRVRGKGCTIIIATLPGGITPACAGKSTGGHHTDAVYRDHPRVCGEKVLSSCWIVSLMGSPPRMRGKVFARLIVFAAGGITPAYAGKSRRFASLYDSIRDHPRVCGEKYSLEKVEKVAMGSPPRMRGKGRPVQRRRKRVGDHPRVCGEKYSLEKVEKVAMGSPPRMRGKAVPLRSAAASGCRGPSVPEYDAPP